MRAVRRPRAPRAARALPTALLPLVVALLPACAGSSARRDGGTPAALLGVSVSPNISLREVKGSPLATDPMRPLADVLQSVWPLATRQDPRQLRALGVEEEVGVYAGTAYLGGWDFLRSVRSGEVARVQRLTTSEAFHRFGRSHVNGAVVLTYWQGGRR